MADLRKIDESRPYKRFKRVVVLTSSNKSQKTDICGTFSPTNYENDPVEPRVNEDIYVLDAGSY